MLNPFVMPKFQDWYGTSGTDGSWGTRLNSSNRYGYDPKVIISRLVLLERKLSRYLPVLSIIKLTYQLLL